MAGSDADIVVLGAGVSSLMLAERLAATGKRAARVILIDPRTRYDDDQTWSFWRVAPHPFESLVEASWQRIAWSSAGWRQTIGSQRYPYQSVPARAFFDRALAAIDADPTTELRLGCSALGVRERAGGVAIETTHGVLNAKWVIDTRPASPPRGALVQRFAGARIRTGKASFAPDTVGLMESMEVDRHGFSFTYLLPYAQDEALVEITRFTTEVLPATQLPHELDRACARLGRGGFSVIRTERGAIPMSVERPAPPCGGVVLAGRRGGAARPSTGYAFLRMARWAESAASAILDGEQPAGHPAEPPMRAALDRIFLRVLTERPELAPGIFLSLASGARSDSIIRFLSDRATPLDVAAVVASLPPLPFLAAIASPAPRTAREKVLA
jgi:lycopene beta-cyclase